MVRTKHQQANHQERRKLDVQFARSVRVYNALHLPKSKKFMDLIMQAVKMHIFSPYKQRTQKNYAVRKV